MIPFIPDNIEFKPTFLLKDDVAGPTSMDLNALLLLKKRVWIGAGYRTGIKLYNKSNLITSRENRTAVMALTELNINNQYRLGYSYDYSLGGLGKYNGSTHEISLGITFGGSRIYNRENYNF